MVSMWLELVIIGVVIISLLIYFWVRINRIKHEKMELHRQLVEKVEVLTHLTEREKRAHEKALQIDEDRKKLLSRINHEIRTPMNGIMGMVSLLTETPLTTEQNEYKETIKNCGESLLMVINDILLGDVLAHAKVDSNTAELEKKEFDLRNSIEDVFEIFANQAAQKDVELVYQIDHRLPAHVIGDNARLRQVLMNLLENAIKFTRQGEIFVKVYRNNETLDTLELGFEITDSGTGISPDDLKFISHTLSQPGAQQNGVGLFLCNRLVQFMGGSLSIESRVQEGTRVRFNIIVHTVPNIQRPHLEMVGAEGKKVLVVEDNATLRQVIQQELLHWKLVPITAESGAQALEILSEKPGIDLVLAEMQMPGMDGMKLARAIREQHPVLPIILVSAANDEGSKQNPEILSSLVNKPIRHSVLGQHILTALIHKNESNNADQNSAKQKLTNDFALKYPLKILIAEDNPMNQKLAVKVLSKLGYKADTVQNGKEVLEEVSKLNYDLILMDVQMPEMDGLEATRMIRLCLSSQPIIIAMTANAMQGDREECISAGMDDYISKPVNIEELVIMLEKWALQVKAKV